MEYKLNCNGMGSLFAVPNSVVDYFLKLAPPNAIKVLLYTLRHNETPLTGEAIAAGLSLSEEAVEEAFCFWEQANVLQRGTGIPAPQLEASVAPVPQIEPVQTKPIGAVQRTSAGFAAKPTEIAERITQDTGKIRALFEMAEQLYGRIPNYTEQRSLLWMHDYLGLDTDVILMLLGYCLSIKKSRVSYVESIAVRWQENEICTLSAAQDEVRRLEQQHTFTADIMHAFDMKHRPTSKQQEQIDDWQKKGYALDLITYAYEKTIENIDKLSFNYISKVLAGWAKDGLTDRAAVDAFQSGRNTDTATHSYDLDAYKSLMNQFQSGN